MERIFAVLATLSDRDLRLLQRRSLARRWLAVFPFVGVSTKDDDLLPTRKSLFDAKIALTRLSQIVRYASSIELMDYDSGMEDLKDHYDPSLVDKAKILALINVLRAQANALPDSALSQRLVERLGRIDEEVRRVRPRWGRIIAACFILFGFLADLKTVNPALYESLFRTAQAIVEILHNEGSVEHHRQRPLLPSGSEAPLAILPPSIEMRRDDQEEA